MKTLSIDLETYSSTDLSKCGVYKYVESEDFEILLFAYAYDDDDVIVLDLAQGESVPSGVAYDIVHNKDITKSAHNAAFERLCLSKYFNQILTADDWHCTMVHATMLGLPASLDAVGKSLGLPEDKQKLATGKALIRYFCKPCVETKINGGRIRNLPHHDTDKWQLFKDYCKQDVESERFIKHKLDTQPIPDEEHQLWCWDQRMNDYGIKLDQDLIRSILNCNDKVELIAKDELKRITRLENPNSTAQLKGWIEKQEGFEVKSLAKDNVITMLENPEISNLTKKVLELRQETSKTSIKKYEAMERSVCSDGRLRGVLQFYGANRTGRWAGRLVQVHNLPQNKLGDIDIARELAAEKDFDLIELLYPSMSDVLSQLIRTAFIPKEGHVFAIADYSAIEARIIAWLSDEKWRNDVFKTHGKIYEASASQMFNIPIEAVTKGSDYRKKGKVAELALGYQGGLGSLKKMGGEKMGLTDREMSEIVRKWRSASPHIIEFWREVQTAVENALIDRTIQKVRHGILIFYKKSMLFIQLPSGRKLSYVRPKLNGGSITYEGTDQSTHKWGRQDTYGGKLVENIVQAVARDCLAIAMMRIDAAGYKIVMHVHDEVIVEVDKQIAPHALKDLQNIMALPIAWAPDLILTADGFISEFYRKD
ncbi:MAG: DNA polymerase [Erysipelotrichaceae bacterium]